MNEMQVNYCFSSPIAMVTLDVQTTSLVSCAYKLKEKDIGRKISNRLGWQSNDIDLQDPNYSSFLHSLTNSVNAYWKKICDGKNDLKCVNMWFNINSKGNYNVSHCHPGSKVSGVFYLQTTFNSGNITFHNPAIRLEYDWKGLNDFKNMSVVNSSVWSYKPKENHCFLFPGWLDHEVESNKSDVDRISISFNYV